jgi:hypothetical protein
LSDYALEVGVARVTVWIPDELLDRAKALNHGENTSQVVRDALQRLVGAETQQPSYASKPVRSDELLGALKERFVVEARDDYESGYRVALEAADSMPLSFLDALARDDFELGRWLSDVTEACRNALTDDVDDELADTPMDQIVENAIDSPDALAAFDGLRQWYDDWRFLWKSAEALGGLADFIGLDRFFFTPTQPRRRGYSDAMRDLWAAVESTYDNPPDATEGR